jgi:hypothetical protein
MSKLNKKSTFTEVKKWFEENELPTTLDAKHIYYGNVPNTVEIYIHQIESEIERLGAENIKRSAVAKAGKNNLFNLYESLKDVSKWNAPLPKFNKLNQRI